MYSKARSHVPYYLPVFTSLTTRLSKNHYQFGRNALVPGGKPGGVASRPLLLGPRRELLPDSPVRSCSDADSARGGVLLVGSTCARALPARGAFCGAELGAGGRRDCVVEAPLGPGWLPGGVAK